MTDAVIVSAARTPIGRAMKGSLIDVDAATLAQVALGAAIERSGVDKADIDDLILAENMQGGGVIGRYAAIELGLTDVPGAATNRHCAGGMTAVQIGAGSIKAGMDTVVVAGGTESLSSMPQFLKSIPASARDFKPWGPPSHKETPDAPAFDMAITVGENTSAEYGLTRQDLDEWAVYSQQQASLSIEKGYFENEIVPVELPGGGLFTTDEHPRPGTTLEKLASLSPLHPELENPTITAANSAGLNDAAAAVVLTSDTYAAANGITPLAKVRSWASAGVEPRRTGSGPIYAIPKALDRAGLTLDDIDLFEINEAFNSVPVAAIRTLGIDPTIVNVNGSGCSLGHPIAATGARMIVTMINELQRQGKTLGLVAMCAGGGMGSATVIELI
jgi:acetyl-CoA acetyltransferase family protein